MKLQTPVDTGAPAGLLRLDDPVLVVGSCFATGIGERLLSGGGSVCLNPFGPLYNPVSLCNAVARMASGRPFSTVDVVPLGASDGRFGSFSHHTKAARSTPEAFLADANATLAEAARFWKDCRTVILTLGTSWAFRWNENGETVANCLKRPAAEFTRYCLSASQTGALLQQLVQRYPGKQFVLTVSPVRHLADGAHGNQLSKARLLLGVEQAVAAPNACYFPAYELLMDELRDYRFYAEDMVHPSDQAVAYICDRFMDWALAPSDRSRYEAARKAFRHAQHRPMDLF